MTCLGSGENDENDSNQDKMMRKNQSSKKMVGKHFMPPTISAASETAVPRKKILAERNESSNVSPDGQDHRRSNLDTKKSPSNSFISHSGRSSSRIVLSYDDDTDCVDGLCVKGYDPLRNYLSPRPKYLRFNPNRRLEILNRLDKEDLELDRDEVESASSVEDIEDSSFSPPKESVLSDDYEEEEEEEEEEEIKERGWCLKGVLKLVLTLVACLLSTSYICSMNSPSPSPTQSAIWDIREDGCFMITNQTHELISMKMHDSSFLKVGDSYSEVEEVEIYDNDHGETEESVEAENVEDGDENREMRGKEVAGIENVDGEDKIDKGVEVEVVKADEPESETNNFEEMVDAKADESSFSLAKEVEPSCLNTNKDDVDKIATAVSESLEGAETKSFKQLIGAEIDGNEYGGRNGLEMEVEVLDQLQEPELPVKSIYVDEAPHESSTEDFHDISTDSGHEVDEMEFNDEAEMEKVGWNSSVVIGISVAFLILTSMGIIYHSKKARTTSVQQPEPAPEKKVAQMMMPSVQRKIEFSARPFSVSSHSTEEASRALNHHIRAPAVELIGEIVVGQVSSSLKSCGKKKQMTESEENNAILKTQSVSPATPAPEQSTNESTTSFGSFTTQTKIKKKEVLTNFFIFSV